MRILNVPGRRSSMNGWRNRGSRGWIQIVFTTFTGFISGTFIPVSGRSIPVSGRSIPVSGRSITVSVRSRESPRFAGQRP